VVVEWRFGANLRPEPLELIIKNEGIYRQSFSEKQHRPIEEFVTAHTAYLKMLGVYVKDRISGLPGTIGFE